MEAPRSEARQSGLTPEQLDELAASLHSVISQHRRRLRQHQDAFRALTLHDRSNAEARIRLREAAAAESRICRAASRALDALADGRFGICTRCGASISIEQLRDRPLSERCAGCARDVPVS